ncbi:hypothetical protein EVAR_102989_1 [Eumeta japonica]|uniref:Uncharacterized protein n=1 Tax=Eumeta variegata TaxID=151549 RepID=A0A4C1UR10_EUMVA|nr:hypothetical protein EVAR_102989_1 [Eumeta japonica]
MSQYNCPTLSLAESAAAGLRVVPVFPARARTTKCRASPDGTPRRTYARGPAPVVPAPDEPPAHTTPACVHTA